GGWPGTFEDVATGVAAVPELLGIPGAPIVAGHSAGGQLALWAATQVPTSGVLALAAVADLTEGYRRGRRTRGGGPLRAGCARGGCGSGMPRRPGRACRYHRYLRFCCTGRTIRGTRRIEQNLCPAGRRPGPSDRDPRRGALRRD